MRHLRANAIAYLALFFALGGVGYAAATVDSADVVDNSLKSKDVRNNTLALKDLSSSATSSLQYPRTLPPGKTARGVYAIDDFSGATNNPSGEFADTAVSYPVALSAAPVLHFIGSGQSAGEFCPGTVSQPEAKPGHLCVYESTSTNRDAGDVAFLYGGGRDRFGFGLSVLAQSGTAGLYGSFGSWAVTGARR